MNDCYLSLLLNFRALLSIDSGANLVNSKQAIGVILPDLSLLGYAVPVESFGIGLFLVLFAYLTVEYNVQLLSHEKLKIAMNMLHTTHTPLILLRNQLEELKTGNLPESLSQQVEEALGYTECIIYCNQNIVRLNKVNKKILPKTSTVNLELSSYITSIVNQCRPYADSRRIQLTVSECSDCVSCRINEDIMTAALQHLISKLILASDLGCCISINITHTIDSWQLQITNCEIADKRVGKMFPFIPVIFPIYGYSDLWTVRKIIRLHGGKINGYRHGKSFAFQIVIPTDCHCRNQECSAIKHSSTNTKNKAKKSSESDKDGIPNTKTKDTSHILLVMADGAFRNYLRKALSRPGNEYYNALGSETRYLNQPKPFRIAEMYLIATEANAKIGTAAAVKKGNDALNALKEARIEGWTDATYDQEALLNEIMNERARELVGEGYRLMDLKRWGKGVKRGKPQSKGLVLFPGQASTDGLDKPVDDQRMLWPIPKTEMDANPQLAGQQNPGY